MDKRDVQPMAANLRSLDVLRGLLAFYVVATHARWLLWRGHAAFMSEPHPAWQKLLAYGSGAFTYGHLAVMVFFALSGFFIHLRMAQKFAQRQTAPQLGTIDYLRRRAWRVLPPYYFALVFTLVIDLVGRAYYPTLYRAATPDAFTNGLFALKGYSPASVIPAVLLVPRSFGLYFGSNGPLWSLGFEMVYYLAYPAWFILRRRFGQKAYLVGFGIALGASVLRYRATVPVADWACELVSLWAVWLAGAWLAELIASRAITRRFVACAGTGAVVAWAVQHLHLPEPANLPLLMVLGAGVTLLFATTPARMNSWAPSRWFEKLGQQSYTLYICHFPVIALIAARCFEISGERPTHGLLALYGVVAAVAVAKVCFYICEAHFIHPRLHLEPKPVVAETPGLALVKVVRNPE